MSAPPNIVTAASARPTELRRQALQLVCEQADADAGLFYQLYDYEGETYFGDLLVDGPGGSDLQIDGVVGRPVPSGSSASSAGCRPWRKGYWDARMPRKDQYNRFVDLDSDIWREPWRETEIWRGFYHPSGIDDQLRALMYDGRKLVGWIAAFRQGEGERFEREPLRAVDKLSTDVLALLSSAHQLESEIQGALATYAVLDPTGRITHATDEAAHYLSGEKMDLVGGLVRRLDSGSSSVSPYVFWNGIQLRIIRLDRGEGVRYMAVIDRAVLPELSPMHRLTVRQREVCDFAAVGCTSREIARHLDVSHHTVRTHLKNAYETLGIGSRAELSEMWNRWT